MHRADLSEQFQLPHPSYSIPRNPDSAPSISVIHSHNDLHMNFVFLFAIYILHKRKGQPISAENELRRDGLSCSLFIFLPLLLLLFLRSVLTTNSPSSTSTITFPPVRTVPFRSSSDNRSSTCFCSARRMDVHRIPDHILLRRFSISLHLSTQDQYLVLLDVSSIHST